MALLATTTTLLSISICKLPSSFILLTKQLGLSPITLQHSTPTIPSSVYPMNPLLLHLFFPLLLALPSLLHTPTTLSSLIFLSDSGPFLTFQLLTQPLHPLPLSVLAVTYSSPTTQLLGFLSLLNLAQSHLHLHLTPICFQWTP